MKLQLNVEAFELARKELGLNNTELAKKMKISRSRIWRAKLPINHPNYCYPGKDFIAGSLFVFKNMKFDDLFFLTNVCSSLHNEEKGD